ncbi:MAG: terpene cyclase/mutase family protein [Eubacterium sp.]|nr:terpene cyclase/mutase family protein [Eubacterium sp.]
MKKRMLCGLLAVLMAGCLALGGCGSTEPQGDTQISTNAEKNDKDNNIDNENTDAGSDNVAANAPVLDADPANNQAVIDGICAFLQSEVTQPTYGTVGGEWTMFDLVRAGAEVDEAYVNLYLSGLTKALNDTNGVLNERRYTEYSRVVIALSALGQNPADFAGYNLIDKISDYESVCQQGLSGPIWALLAMDSVGYEFSQDIEAEVVSTREAFVDYILKKQHELGGWGYDPNEPDPDFTAMAIVALAPYAKENPEVQAAIDTAVQALSELQSENGMYESGGVATAESCAQVVLALATIGIDGDTDERFIKNGISVYDALLSFALKDGSFCHIKGDGMDMIATEQTGYCLIGYERFLDGQTPLFDLSDMK